MFFIYCRCILATDMAKHNEILNNFKSYTPDFDFCNKDHKALVRYERECKTEI